MFRLVLSLLLLGLTAACAPSAGSGPDVDDGPSDAEIIESFPSTVM